MREERLSKMEAYIRLQKSVSLDTLCEVFGISKNTVRRDIADIIARTDIRKIYGGVSIPYNKIPPPFEERMSINTDKKDCIGRLAYPELNIISLSGTLNRKTLSFTGQSTIDTLQSFNISKAFMAANGITLQNGATQSTSIEFAIKKSVVERSHDVYLLVENRKFGVVSLYTYCPLDRIDVIVTDAAPTADFSESYRELGGRIISPE